MSVKIIASQPYIKVSRKVERNQQLHQEEQLMIQLCESEIITESQRFGLNDVTDISYREISRENWFLYFHTTQGLFSYHVKNDPANFVDAYKRIR